VWALLSRPGETWERIDAEPATVKDLYRNWVAPLAAIPAVCNAVGKLAFGIGIFGVGMRPSVGSAIAEMLAAYVATLAEVYLLSLVIDRLAPTYGGARGPMAALKLTAYSGTALWIAGILALYPPVGWLAGILGGLCSLYLLYVGLPKLMRTSPEQQLSFFAVVLLAGLGIAVVVGILTQSVRDFGGPLSTMALVTGQTAPA
jgi:hypothetical protein